MANTQSITNDDELALVQQELGRAEAALGALRRDLLPRDEARFRLVAAGHVDRILALRAEIDAYLGLDVGHRRRGVVSFDGTRAGIIEETATGGSRFTYDPPYLTSPNPIAISATLPLRPEPYEHLRGLHPFFENLLPEGWLLDRTCEKLGIDRTDAFGLMLATCADTAGAVEIVPEPPPGFPEP